MEGHGDERYQTEVWPLPLSPRELNVEAFGGGAGGSGRGMDMEPGRESGMGVGSTYSRDINVS
jgi:hypothetical protein